MATTGFLGGSGLSPFGGGGVNFGAFDIAGSVGEQAYLIFRKKEILWEQGKLSNADYLTALKAYGDALPEGSEKLNAQTRYDETRYRVERNTLISDIEDGDKEWSDLLAYDKAKLAEVSVQDSAEYDARLSNVREVQARMFSEQEDVMREKYEDGKITATALSRWYEGFRDGDLTADNPELDEAIAKRLDDLGDIILNEKDAKMIGDFNEGKVGYNEFVAYGNVALGRYAKGTEQYNDWTDRLETAKDQALEQSLTYRYGLSQRYEQLAKFVKDHGTAPKGSYSTSTRKGTPRVVWTGSGWKTVMVGGGTKTTYSGPSASEQQAWKKLQIEVKDAKRQMAEIAAQVAKQPGGWVTTDDMIYYYRKVQTKFAKGSSEWYTVQERLDGLSQAKHAEAVLRKQGVVISYPSVKSETKEYGSGGSSTPGVPASSTGKPSKASSTKAGPSTKANDGDISLDQFMAAIARVESGGRYDAVNKSSGAKGKYQIMPANWSGWANKYLGDPHAQWTPENQEKVARGKMQDLYEWLGDWRAVAHWWLTGGSNKDAHRNPNSWSSSSRNYVNKVFAGMGKAPTPVTSGSAKASSGGGASGPPAGSAARPIVPSSSVDKETGQRIETRSAFDIPKNLDGRQYERFYQRFLDAYEQGEESFVDYSSGRAIAYFIPSDLDQRSEMIGYLDEVRVAYFAERARAYEGTPSEEVAMTQYSDAIKKSGENQILILDTHTKFQPWDPAGMNRTQGPQQAAGAINPIASGLKLKEQTEAALTVFAANAKKAFERGDDEMAYAIIQRGLDLAAKNDETLRTYYANANAQLRAILATGADLPDMVKSDLESLAEGLDFDASDGKVSPGYAKALQTLDEVSGELEKFIQFDPVTDEPINRAGATPDDMRFVYKDGVDLFLKPNGTVEHKQTAFTGWTDPNTPSRDRDKYVTVTVKIGNSIKQVKAPWEPAVIGFVENSNTPIMGKLISGMLDGKEYTWVENPFAPGKWIKTNPNQPLVIKAPADFQPFRSDTGGATFQFTAGGGGPRGQQTYRLEFDDEDGTYHIFEAPGLFGSDWKDLGSATSDSQVAELLSGAWKVDTSMFKGDDALFTNSTGAWIGFDKTSFESAMRNLQGPRATTKQGYQPGWRNAPGNAMPPALQTFTPQGFQLAPGNAMPPSLKSSAYNDGAKSAKKALGGGYSTPKEGLPPIVAKAQADSLARKATYTTPNKVASKKPSAKLPAKKKATKKKAGAPIKKPTPKPTVKTFAQKPVTIGSSTGGAGKILHK